MNRWMLAAACLAVLPAGAGLAQQDAHRDRAVFQQPKNEFLDELEHGADAFIKKENLAQASSRVDFGGIKGPGVRRANSPRHGHAPFVPGAFGNVLVFLSPPHLLRIRDPPADRTRT